MNLPDFSGGVNKLQWIGPEWKLNESANFLFQIRVGDSAETESSTFKLMLQEFPMVALDPVPVPGTYVLVAIALPLLFAGRFAPRRRT